MKKKILWLLLSCLMVVALVLASCGPAVTEEEEEEVVTEEEEEEVAEEEEEEEEGPEMVVDSLGRLVEKPKYGGVYVEARSGDVLYFDEIGRFIHYSQSQQLTNEALYRGDWAKGPTGTGEATWYHHLFPPMDISVGIVAESWELADDTTIVLHIRKGMHFHDKPPTNGRELVAEDVRYSLWRIWNIETSYNYAAYPWDLYFESMEATDKYTVVVKAQSPARLAGIFDMMFMHHRIVPKDAVEFYGDLYDWENAIGTGPFLLVDYVPVSSLTFERNPNYWGNDPFHPDNQLPYVDGVKWLIIPDLSTRIAALRTAKVDRLALNWEEADAVIKTNPELKYISYLVPSSAGIWFKLDNPDVPVYDKRVRHALYMATNQKEILDEYYGGYGELLNWPVSPIPEDINMFTPLEELPESTRKLFEYHPDEAKQLLAEAGYPNGFKVDVIVTPTGVDLLAIVQAMWAEVGVEVQMVVRETAAYNSMLYGKKYEQMAFGGYSSSNPYRYYYDQPGSSINFANHTDQVILAAFTKVAASRFDEPGRQALVKENVPYRLDLAYYLQLPGYYAFVFWQPWIKAYTGEFSVGYAHHYDYVMNVWMDQDLKEEMTGKR